MRYLYLNLLILLTVSLCHAESSLRIDIDHSGFKKNTTFNLLLPTLLPSSAKVGIEEAYVRKADSKDSYIIYEFFGTLCTVSKTVDRYMVTIVERTLVSTTLTLDGTEVFPVINETTVQFTFPISVAKHKQPLKGPYKSVTVSVE